ncbi:MAG: hypothetical protein RPU52_14870 [Candidatus Sedimenticola sp. (ex Thyasira tokunagai)]
MDYEIGRANAVRRASLGTIKKLLANFDPYRKTVILLPGGMGSHLERSPEKFQGEPMSFDDYDPVWMDTGILFGDARKMEIDSQGRDKDGHIIVPNGALHFLIDSYDGTEKFFTDGRNGDYNYTVFGFDWRRPIEECAAVLEEFLTLFKSMALKRFGRNPLPDTTLMCHSQGGLVASFFMRRIIAPHEWFEHLITVGSPLYGTMVQQPRYFIGQAPLSQLYGARTIAKISSTLPGPYSFMCLDMSTYDRYHGDLGLTAYPSTDPDNGDPLDPYDLDNLDRYPAWINRDHVEAGRDILQTFSDPLEDEFAQRYFNIRSWKCKTPVAQTWSRLPDNYNPDISHSNPIDFIKKKKSGDGTVPSWSVWHKDTPADNRVQLNCKVEHQDLAEHEETLRTVKQIVDTGSPLNAPAAADQAYGDPFDFFDLDQIEAFTTEIKKGNIKRDDQKNFNKALWRGLMKEVRR